jgi:hypothetical protein
LNTIVCKSKFSFENFGELCYISKSVIINLFGEPQVMHQNQPFFFWGGGGTGTQKKVKKKNVLSQILKSFAKI